MTDPRSQKRNSFSLAQKLQFAEYMKTHYTISGLDNNEFAKQAAAALGFPVSQNQVFLYRTELEIPANKPRANPEGKTSRLSALEKRVEVLEKRIEVYLKGSL